MRTLSYEHLLQVLRDLIEEFPENDLLLRAYGLAAEVLVHFLGPKWVQQRVFTTGKGDRYLRTHADALLDKFKHQDRVIALGEMLFHLQSIHGFQSRARQLRNEQSVESTMAELEGAKHLLRKAIPFRFVRPRGVKGQDYDLEIALPNARLPCDSKCKVESTGLRATTITDSIDAAGSQLPTDRPGVVFMKLPESWVRSPSIAQQADEGLRAAFERRRHLAGVILHWETWELRGEKAIRTVQFRSEVSENCDFMTDPLRDNIRDLQTPPVQDNWDYFRRLASKAS